MLDGEGALSGVDVEVLGAVVIAVDVEQGRIKPRSVVDSSRAGWVVRWRARQIGNSGPPVKGLGVDERQVLPYIPRDN